MNKQHMRYVLSTGLNVGSTEPHVGWYVTPNGQLLGFENDTSKVLYEFWIGNPPHHYSRDYELFVAICDFAVAQGILRKIHTYALADK